MTETDAGDAMSRPAATITQKKIKHNDPKAAGFTTGYWWKVERPALGDTVESGSATLDDAKAACAAALGVPVEKIDFTVS